MPDTVSTPAPPHSPRRAMIVDDHEDAAASLALMLQTLGFETIVASDGIDALRRASEFKPHLVLLDIGMPKLDGYDTCGVIRAQPWGGDVRLIAVTGQDPDTLEERSRRAGFDAYLLKPVDFDDIRRIAQPS